jgi:hypothetical protein
LLRITGKLQHQLSVWRTRLPSSNDSVETWDDIVLNRSAFLVHLKQSLEQRVGAMAPPQQKHLQHVLTDVRADLSRAVVEMHRKAANVMLRQGNTQVADKYITAARQLLQAHGIVQSPSMGERETMLLGQLDFLLTYSSVRVKRKHLELVPITSSANDVSLSGAAAAAGGAGDEQARRARQKAVKSLKALLNAASEAGVKLKRVGRSLASQPDNAYRVFSLKAQLGEQLAEQVLHDPTLAKFTDNKSYDALLQEAGDELDVMSSTFKSLLSAPRLAGPERAAERARVHHRADKAFMAVVTFCDHRLSASEEHRDSCDTCKAKAACIHPLRLQAALEQHLIEALVDNVLAAMRLGSTEARQSFPRALELMARALELMGAEAYEASLHARFLEETAQIPAWMFIQWIPQLLSMIALPQASLVFPLLLRIAKEYPQAIYYPHRLSRESLDQNFVAGPAGAGNGRTPAVAQAIKYLNIIGVHLKNKLIELVRTMLAFVQRMQYVCQSFYFYL